MGRQLTDSIEVLYVHTTIKGEGGTEGVERDGSGQRREGEMWFIILFQLLSVILNWP
jgi:hypothetical protein